MESSGWLVYFASLIPFFLIGFYLISTYLFQDHEIKSKFPIIMFSTIFSFSLMLLEMIFFEIFSVGTLENRYLKWIVTLCALTYASLFVIPTLLLTKFLTKLKLGRPIKVAISLVSGVAYLWLISKALLEEIREHQPDRKDDYFMGWSTVLKNLEIFLPLTQVPVLASVGMVLLAILSGFGAVNLPVSLFKITDEKMLLLNQSMFDTKMIEILGSISKKKIKNLQLKQKLEDEGNNPGASKGFFSWFTTSSKSNDLDKQITENELEIKMLKKAHNELFLDDLTNSIDHCDFTQDMQTYQQSKSILGHIQRFLAKILSMYCLYKILISMVNIVFGRGRGVDPINNGIKLAIRISKIELNEDIYEMISIHLSFLFLGILIFLNVKSFVKNFLEVFRFVFRRLLSEVFFSELIVHFLSEILAIYFISSFILMYNNFPVQHRKNMETLLGDLDFRALYRVFDTIFVLSVLGSAAILWLNAKLKKMKYRRYLEDQEYESYKTK